MQIRKKQSINLTGYSLIELTIVVGLVSILSITISAIVLSTIVSSNRIRNQVRLRQTGDYAIGQIQTMVRNARAINTCPDGLNTIDLTGQDNKQTTIALSTNRVASVSAAASVYLTPDDVMVDSFSLSCLPSEDEPKIVNISFVLTNTVVSGRTSENPTQKFTTSVELRNE